MKSSKWFKTTILTGGTSLLLGFAGKVSIWCNLLMVFIFCELLMFKKCCRKIKERVISYVTFLDILWNLSHSIRESPYGGDAAWPYGQTSLECKLFI